jgi:hypothetical protein
MRGRGIEKRTTYPDGAEEFVEKVWCHGIAL